MPHPITPSPAHAPVVTSTDLWKTAALLLILADHIGHYLLPDLAELRVAGRIAVPVWFFFIGFAKAREVPLRWVLAGAMLTLIDVLWENSLQASQISILLSFALFRLARPVVETRIIPHPRLLAIFVLALVLVAPLANMVLEYGSEGWLFALLGVFHRRHVDQEPAGARLVVAAVAASLFLALEIHDYEFPPALSMAMAAGVLGATAGLLHFRRESRTLPEPARPLAAILHFCGQNSLALYAGQIVLLAALGTAMGLRD